jgi:hypothetical protein
MDSHPTSARPDPAPAAQELTAKGPDATGPFTPVSAARGRTLLDAALGFCAGAAAIRTGWSLAPDLVEATSAAPWKVAVGGGLTLGLALLLFAARPGLGTRLGPGAGAPQGPRAGAPKGPRAGALQAPSATPHGTFEPLTGLVALAGAAFGAASALLDPAQGGPAWPWLVVGAALAWMARFARRSGGVSLDHSIRHTSGRAVTRPATGTAGSRDEGVVPKATRLLALAAVALGVSGALAALGRIAARTMPVEPARPHGARRDPRNARRRRRLCFRAPVRGRTRPRRGNATAARSWPSWSRGSPRSPPSSSWVVSRHPRGCRRWRGASTSTCRRAARWASTWSCPLAVFVLPAFAVGAALHLCASRAAWTAVALGAGLGAALSTVVPLAPSSSGSWRCCPRASPQASSCGAAAAPSRRCCTGSSSSAQRRSRQASGCGGRRASRASCWRSVARRRCSWRCVSSPSRSACPRRSSGSRVCRSRWSKATTGSGSSSPGGRGTERVSLDHRLVVPGSERARGDRDQLVVSFALLDEAVRSRGAACPHGRAVDTGAARWRCGILERRTSIAPRVSPRTSARWSRS